MVKYNFRCPGGLHNDVSNRATSGRLYNWYAVDHSRGLCPNGWHVPTDGECWDLEAHINSEGTGGYAGTALRSSVDRNGDGNGTDEFGFSAIPSGNRNDTALFAGVGLAYDWWSSTENGDLAWRRGLTGTFPGIIRRSYLKNNGLSFGVLGMPSERSEGGLMFETFPRPRQ
jgi:uncharacterized protein (TIGR02145 family)